jgi:CO dehydrogenase/acetyl-CoA synthase beta subunit
LYGLILFLNKNTGLLYMSTWFDWAMGNSTFESLPQHIKDTAQWQRYQTTVNEREVQLKVAEQRLAEAKQAAEEWAAEKLEEEAERAAESAQHEQLLAEGARNLEDERRRGGRRRRRRTRKRRHKRRKKTRRRGRRQR